MSTQLATTTGASDVVHMGDAGAPAAFAEASASYADALLALADVVRPDEPGTAELLFAYAERHVDLAQDLLSRWP